MSLFLYKIYDFLYIKNELIVVNQQKIMWRKKNENLIGKFVLSDPIKVN